MKGFWVGLAALAAAAPGGAAADDAVTEITAFGGYRFGGSFDVIEGGGSYDFDDAPSFGLIVNHEHSAETQWELFFSRESTTAEFGGVAVGVPAVDVDTSVLEIGGTYLWEGERVQPYLAATIGATHMSASANGSESDTYWSGSIGFGMRVAPTARVGVRLEVRFHGAFTSDSTDLFCRTGPDANVCAVRVEGDLFSRTEAFAGITARF